MGWLWNATYKGGIDMLTKEECKKALVHLEECYWDQVNSYRAMNEVRKDLDILNELINEHFSNPPLKFEEIKTCEPIFDKKDYGWVLVMKIDPYQKSMRIIDVDCKNNWIDFEFNRFYRKEVRE